MGDLQWRMCADLGQLMTRHALDAAAIRLSDVGIGWNGFMAAPLASGGFAGGFSQLFEGKEINLCWICTVAYS
jgi:hypothetical protein